MASDDSTGTTGKAINVDTVFLAIFRLGVPMMLGAILTFAVSISSAQTKQGESLAELKGSLAVMASQTTDYTARLAKVEAKVEDLSKVANTNSARLLVVESGRHFK